MNHALCIAQVVIIKRRVRFIPNWHKRINAAFAVIAASREDLDLRACERAYEVYPEAVGVYVVEREMPDDWS